MASAASAIALILLLSATTEGLKRLGIKMVVNAPDVPITTDPSQLLLFLILVVVVAPLAEELMFRGLLLDWLRQKMTAWPATLIVSLLFAVIHNNNFRSGVGGWLELTDRFLIGIGTSILALRYRSLRPPFVLHATNNCVVAAITALT